VKDREAPEQTPFVPPFSVTDTELRLDRDHFTERDLLILRDIIAGTKYEIIASGQGMGLSTLKKRLASLFSLLEVRDRVQFLARYGNHSLAWDDRRQGGGGTEASKTGIVGFPRRS
jgi:DNA-binding NarL/FixJ family response regulator